MEYQHIKVPDDGDADFPYAEDGLLTVPAIARSFPLKRWNWRGFERLRPVIFRSTLVVWSDGL